jgi:hypothetical protein
MSRRGFAETGRPPFLTVARASISGIASGSSTYSRAFVTCASTRLRSDFKERRDAPFFAAIGFPHAEYVMIFATRCISDDHHASLQISKADDPSFAVVFAQVLHFERRPSENERRVLKVETTILECLTTLLWVVGDRRLLS